MSRFIFSVSAVTTEERPPYIFDGFEVESLLHPADSWFEVNLGFVCRLVSGSYMGSRYPQSLRRRIDRELGGRSVASRPGRVKVIPLRESEVDLVLCRIRLIEEEMHRAAAAAKSDLSAAKMRVTDYLTKPLHFPRVSTGPSAIFLCS